MDCDNRGNPKKEYPESHIQKNKFGKSMAWLLLTYQNKKTGLLRFFSIAAVCISPAII